MRSIVVPALVLGVLATFAAPAQAAPPTERTISDPVEPDLAYDIVSVTLSSAPAPGEMARVSVEHDRRVRTGDGLELWVDTDADRQPDLYLIGYAFSEYAVFKARGWDGRGRNISDRGCASLTMRGARSVVRFAPSCVGASTTFAVSVRSFVQGEPDATADHLPGPDRLTKKVLSYQPA